MPDPPATLSDADFGREYYLEHVGRPYVRDDAWLRFFTPIADCIVSAIAPRRVLDAGCGPGLLVELLRARGVEAFGLDISSYAIAHLPDVLKPYCWRASVTDELQEHYDLIVCQEVFPHLVADQADRAIANFCRHTDDVLFSSPLTVDRSVRRHVNSCRAGHFAGIFARHGFHRDFTFDGSVMTPWAVRFRRTGADLAAAVTEYEDRWWEQRQRADRLEAALHDTRRQVADMQRSWFWRLRQPWTWLTGR